RSFEDVIAQRQSELAGRLFEINPDEAMRDLLPLAQNYLASEVFRRVSHASGFRMDNGQSLIRNPKSTPGLWSELRFRLRRPLGILTGTIDKLLITPSASGEGFDIEIIDFKTNRFRLPSKPKAKSPQGASARATVGPARSVNAFRAETSSQPAQALFNFEMVETEVPANVPTTVDVSLSELKLSIGEQAKTV